MQGFGKIFSRLLVQRESIFGELDGIEVELWPNQQKELLLSRRGDGAEVGDEYYCLDSVTVRAGSRLVVGEKRLVVERLECLPGMFLLACKDGKGRRAELLG